MRRVVLVLVLLASSLASAVVWRHDVDAAAVLALGAKFPAVGRVLPSGSGTLIAPTWVLTAGHVAEHLPVKQSIAFGGRVYRIKQAYVHPQGHRPTDAMGHPIKNRPPEVDLGLLELEAPVTGVVPLALYRGRDELGKTMTIVGCGDFGPAGARRPHEDGRCRAVTNQVADAGPRRLFFPFDAPPAGTSLEGIGVAGDSGGPALIEVDGQRQVAGVSSGGDGPPGAYGTVDIYTRVSSYLPWIDQIVGCAREGTPHVYAGPPRPIAELACVTTRPGEGWSLSAKRVAGHEVPAGANAFYALPGTPEFEFECGAPGTTKPESRTPMLELKAGYTMRLNAVAAKDGSCAYFWTPDYPVQITPVKKQR